HAEEQIDAVNSVLDEIGAAGKPTLMVFNKVDLLQNVFAIEPYLARFPNAVAISAQTGQGIPNLLSELGTLLRPIREFVELSVPHANTGLIARLHSMGQVVERNYQGKTARFKARIPPYLLAEFEPFIVGNGSGNGH